MGLPVAIPAATSAFGGAMAASTVMAPALLSAAAVAAPMAAVGSSMMMAPSIMSAGGAGFFGGISSMFSNPLGGLMGNANLMDVGFGLSKVFSVAQSISQGQILKNQYELQGIQALADMEMKQYNATVDGMDRLRRLRQIQSANLAKSTSRGVSGLSGSALLNQIVSDQEYGKDYKIEMSNLANIASSGQVNSDIYKATAKNAVTSSVLDAGIKLGEAAYSYDKLYKTD